MSVVIGFLYISIIILCMTGILVISYTLKEEGYYILKLIKVNKYGFNKDIPYRYLDWDIITQYILFNLLLKKEYRKEFEKYYKERYDIK